MATMEAEMTPTQGTAGTATKAARKPRSGYGDGGISWVESRQRYVVSVEGNPDPVTGKRRRVNRWVKTKTEAREAKKELQKLVNNRQDLASTMRLTDWLDRWLENKRNDVRPTTFRSYRTQVNDYIKPQLGRVKLGDLKGHHIASMSTSISATPKKDRKGELILASDGSVEKHGPKAAKYAHTVLAIALGDAKREGLIDDNVAGREGPKKARTTTKETDRLNAPEGVLLLTKSRDLGDDSFSRWTTALLTGLRQGECLGLTWDRVDFSKGLIDIEWQLQFLPNEHGCGELDEKTGEWPCGKTAPRACKKKVDVKPAGFVYEHLQGSAYLTRPKTARSVRFIPMASQLTQVLLDWREQTIGHYNPHNLVWHGPSGAPIHVRDDHQEFLNLLASAGLRHVKLHSLRHTAASVLLAAGVDLATVQAILGHTSVDVTKIYAEMDMERIRVEMNKLGDVITPKQKELEQDGGDYTIGEASE